MKKLLGGLVAYFNVEHALFLIPIFAFAVYDSAFAEYSSILAMLSDVYPDVPKVAIQMILAVPVLTSIPATLIAGILAAYVRKKYIAEIALAFIFIGGVIPLFFERPNIYLLFFATALIGVGQGFLHPLGTALVSEYWNDMDQRGRVLGFMQAFNFLGAAIVAFLVGVLAVSRWNNSFLVFLMIVPVFLVTHFALPKGELDKRLVSRKRRFEGLKGLLKPIIIYLLIVLTIAAVLSFAFRTNIAMLVSEKKLGNVVDVAQIAALLNIVAFIMGVAFGKFTKLADKYSLSLGFAGMTAGLFIIAFGPNLVAIYIGAILYGLGLAINQICALYYLSRAAGKHLVTIVISLLMACMSFGAAGSPSITVGLETLILGTGLSSNIIAVSASLFVLLTIIEFIHAYLQKRDKDRGVDPGKNLEFE